MKLVIKDEKIEEIILTLAVADRGVTLENDRQVICFSIWLKGIGTVDFYFDEDDYLFTNTLKEDELRKFEEELLKKAEISAWSFKELVTAKKLERGVKKDEECKDKHKGV